MTKFDLLVHMDMCLHLHENIQCSRMYGVFYKHLGITPHSCSRTSSRVIMRTCYMLLLLYWFYVPSSFQMGFVEKMCDESHLMVILK